MTIQMGERYVIRGTNVRVYGDNTRALSQFYFPLTKWKQIQLEGLATHINTTHYLNVFVAGSKGKQGSSLTRLRFNQTPPLARRSSSSSVYLRASTSSHLANVKTKQRSVTTVHSNLISCTDKSASQHIHESGSCSSSFDLLSSYRYKTSRR